MSSKRGEPVGKIPALVLEEAESGGDESPPPEADVVEQSWWSWKPTKVVAKRVDIDGDELRKSLDDITSKLERVLEGQAQRTGDFGLDSFIVGLAVEGRGKVFLVAEVGVQASIQLTFKRR
jgi:tetrahydromethanopterin S-methyltransferase subunit G